jgi:hypothetical protein
LIEWFYLGKRLEYMHYLKNEQIYYQGLWDKEKLMINKFIYSNLICHNFLFILVV